MWPLYLLFNKLLKTEEENNQRPTGNHLNLVESCPYKPLLSKEKCNSEALSQSGSVEVPHISQQYTWDCGLACVLMVLRTLGIEGSDIQELEVLCCTTSIWTVDLAYLLQKFSVKFSYYTVTLGANPNFSVETFYKDQLPNDLRRVDMLFQRACDAGIHIECRSISGQEISLLVLSRKYIAIALVDQYILSRSWLQDVCISAMYNDGPSYTGHYVIICGYDATTDEFEIRDPARSRLDIILSSAYVNVHMQGRECTLSVGGVIHVASDHMLACVVCRFRKHERISSRRLEEARKAIGTDEDLLLISLVKE